MNPIHGVSYYYDHVDGIWKSPGRPDLNFIAAPELLFPDPVTVLPTDTLYPAGA